MFQRSANMFICNSHLYKLGNGCIIIAETNNNSENYNHQENLNGWKNLNLKRSFYLFAMETSAPNLSYTHTHTNSLIENQRIYQKSCAYTDNNSSEPMPVSVCLCVRANACVCATVDTRTDADSQRLFVKLLFRVTTTPRELLIPLSYPLCRSDFETHTNGRRMLIQQQHSCLSGNKHNKWVFYH